MTCSPVHPDLVPLYLARQGARGPHAYRLGETTDALLARTGLRPEAVPVARRALIVHTIGSAAFTTNVDPTRDTAQPIGADRPIPKPESRNNFQTSLNWLLTGISRNER
jgi:TetR/AcrR family tetracycline transcriptional repressor